MANQLYPKLETWWLKSQESVSLEDVASIPIFHKLFQITGKYDYSFRDFQESFNEVNGVRELRIEMKDGKNKEIARFKPEDESCSYYKLYQYPDHEYELEVEWNHRLEFGTEVKREAKRTYVKKWEKILDVHSNQEYFPENECKLYIFKLTEEVTEELFHKIKTTSTSYHCYEKRVEKEKNNQKIIKIEKINKRGKSSTVTTIKNDETSICFKKENHEIKQEIMRITTKNKESKQKTTEFLHNNSKMITSKEITKNSITGHKKYSFNELADFYDINWVIENSMFFSEIDVVVNSKVCYKKRILFDDNEFLEMEDINSDINNWGCINRHFDNSTFHLKWTGVDNQIYTFHIQRFNSIISKEAKGPPDLSLYRLVQLATVDTEYIYESLKTVENFCFHYFSGLSKVIFQDHSLISYLFPESLLEKFQEREDLRRSFVEYTDNKEFQNFVLNYSDMNNKTLVVQEYYRLEKFMSFVLKSANLKSKVSYSRNFCLAVYIRLQALIFDLDYALELIKIINESSDASSIQLERKGFIDQSSFSVICTVCNSVCHEDCRIDSHEIELGNKKIKECSRFRSLNNRCSHCFMNCPSFYHVSTLKSIQVDRVSLSSSEFNRSYEQAEGFINRFSQIICEDGLNELVIMKLNHFVLVRQKFLKKSGFLRSGSLESPSDASFEKSNEKEKYLANQEVILKEIELAYQQISKIAEV